MVYYRCPADASLCHYPGQVGLTSGMPAHWRLLKSRLEALCPTSTGNMWMRHYRNGTVDTEHPFLLQVSSYDRVGVLHGAQLGCCGPRKSSALVHAEALVLLS